MGSARAFGATVPQRVSRGLARVCESSIPNRIYFLRFAVLRAIALPVVSESCQTASTVPGTQMGLARRGT